jgi:hypothetical protein
VADATAIAAARRGACRSSGPHQTPPSATPDDVLPLRAEQQARTVDFEGAVRYSDATLVIAVRGRWSRRRRGPHRRSLRREAGARQLIVDATTSACTAEIHAHRVGAGAVPRGRVHTARSSIRRPRRSRSDLPVPGALDRRVLRSRGDAPARSSHRRAFAISRRRRQISHARPRYHLPPADVAAQLAALGKVLIQAEGCRRGLDRTTS